MTEGLILLGFIAVLIAFGMQRFRRRMGLPTPGAVWATIIAVVVLVVLAMWAYSTHR
ncbi:MAG TPA: hypothetical protein VGS19_15900 [Streptosporangiaceae bacterium]|nr:hypothetical protein [Streptosporangiaceae bacterium]